MPNISVSPITAISALSVAEVHLLIAGIPRLSACSMYPQQKYCIIAVKRSISGKIEPAERPRAGY